MRLGLCWHLPGLESHRGAAAAKGAPLGGGGDAAVEHRILAVHLRRQLRDQAEG